MTSRWIARLEIDLVLTRSLVGEVKAKHARMPHRDAGILSAERKGPPVEGRINLLSASGCPEGQRGEE